MRKTETGRLQSLVVKIAAAEFVVVASAAFFGSLVYPRLVFFEWPDPDKYVPASLVLAAFVSLISVGFRHFYSMQTRPRHTFLWNGLGAVALAFSFFLTTIYLFKVAEIYSRGAFIFQIFFVGIAILAERTLSYAYLQNAIASGAVEGRRVILIGEATECSRFAYLLRTAGIDTVHSFPFPVRETVDGSTPNSAINEKAKRAELVQLARALRSDDILILASPEELATVSELASSLSELPVGIHIVPVGSADLLSASRIVEFGNIVTMQVSQPPLSALDLAIKRIFDFVVAAVGLVMFSPLMLLVALLIKLDSRGPVFFRQSRHGYNNETIRVVKFRTMTVAEDGDNFTQAVRNDPRITRFGRVLRRANIDELPQLFNVLIGEMSIVGPRPHAIAHNRMFEDRIPPLSRRHNVKPGITGWAQVNGYRGETDTLEKMERRVQYDLYYIDNWSLMLDIKIITMTLFSKKTYVNAY